MTSCLRFAFGFLLILTASAYAESGSSDEGMRIFKSANCVGCHKWTGMGGGGYGGAAANLRRTQLSLEQIQQTIRCGRLTTGMPHFDHDAYTDGRCYGVKEAQLGPGKTPPEPDHYLRPSDIQAVATYVFTQIKGKGDPTLAECQTFFGSGTRVCDTYGKSDEATVQHASEPSGGGSSSHLKIESAPDANAGDK